MKKTTQSSNQRKDIHTISMLVANKPGVLVRIAHVFARRAYNVDSLVVSPAFNPRFSRMTITAQGDPDTLEQIIKQVNKLIDVIHIGEHTEKDALHTEVALIKIKYTPATKPIIAKQLKKYQTTIIDDSDNTFIVQQVGKTDDLDELEIVLKKYNVIEMVRTGKIIMVRGHQET